MTPTDLPEKFPTLEAEASFAYSCKNPTTLLVTQEDVGIVFADTLPPLRGETIITRFLYRPDKGPVWFYFLEQEASWFQATILRNQCSVKNFKLRVPTENVPVHMHLSLHVESHTSYALWIAWGLTISGFFITAPISLIFSFGGVFLAYLSLRWAKADIEKAAKEFNRIFPPKEPLSG